MSASEQLLAVRSLTAGYGQVKVIRDADFDVHRGEIVVLLGSNGAGKTTTLRALSGVVTRTGRTIFDGADISGLRTERVARSGIGHVPQGRGTFPDLTVEENLRIGGYRRSRREVEEGMARWFDHFPRLAERRKQLAGAMSGGEQQMLAIARALMPEPKLLLLDEPSLGLAPKITAELFEILAELNRATGLAMLIVEQNAAVALGVASRAYVLESGKLSAPWEAGELAQSDEIRRAYLGQ